MWQIGVAVVSGFLVLIFVRGRWNQDYAYHVPELDVFGCGQRSVGQALDGAEEGIDAATRDEG